MPIHYHGQGALLSALGRPTDLVEYAFDLHREQGPIGYLTSKNARLPRLRTVRLRLANHLQYVAVRLIPTEFDRARQCFRYQLFLAPDQPTDSQNLLFTATRHAPPRTAVALAHSPGQQPRLSDHDHTGN
jgi:hypothetical protein